MNVERIKSIILTGLVLLSIFLFGYIMTFQQNYDQVENQEYLEETIISHRVDIKELIQPKKILWKNHSRYSGTEAMIAIRPVVDELQKWNFYDFYLALEEFTERWKAEGEALIFQYNGIPLELVKTILTVEQDELPVIVFQYMIVFPNDIEKTEAIVYFVSRDFNQAVKSRVKYTNYDQLLSKLDELEEKMQPYLVYERTSGTILFVNNQPELHVKTYPYYTTEIPIQSFVEVLFPDPSVVTKTENTYTNGTSLLEVSSEDRTLHFVNPTVTKDQTIAPSQIIQAAMNFVNQHGGWTDSYLFSHLDLENQEVFFQLFLSDYMVVGSNELSVQIGNSGIYSYERPFYTLNFPVQPYVKNLPPGEEVLAHLESEKGIDLDEVEDISIGYEMSFLEDEAMLKFEPFWYYRIDTEWRTVFDVEQGGDHDGLE